jgi:hypothetical protein
MSKFWNVTFVICFAAGCALADDVQQLADKARSQGITVCKSVQSSAQCHTKYAAGCGRTAQSQYDPYLNFLKNRLVPMDSQPTNSQPEKALNPQELSGLESQIPSGLVPNNHASFSAQFAGLREGSIVEAIGYVYYAQQTGAESCNCERAGPADSDYHIGLGFDRGLAGTARSKPTSNSDAFHQLQANSMIVEVTPYYRAKFEPDWTLEKIKALYGKQVRVVGQLIADNDHYDAEQDCGMKGADSSKCWRLSIWEIHPVTAFYVCNSSSGCDAGSTNWVKLEAWRAAQPQHSHRSRAPRGSGQP